MDFFRKKNRRSINTSILEVKKEQATTINSQIQVAADQLKGVVEQINLASITLEETSSSSKDKTSLLLSHSEKTVEYTNQVSNKVKKIESSALHISAFSQEILSNSQTANDELNISFESFQLLQQKFDMLSKSHYTLLSQMNKLVSNSQKIEEIVHTIGAISQKTKILALNAAIEAARAGEHGKGFSVVANEVGHLANQTTQAVEETRDMINLIQKEIEISTEMVNGETTQVEEGSKEVNNVIVYVQSFKNKLCSITKMVSDSTEAVDEQRDSVHEIAILLHQISEMAIENKEFVDQVTSDLDTQHQNVEEIREITHSLVNTSTELQNMIQQDPSNIQSIQLDQSLIHKMQNELSLFSASPPLRSMDIATHQHQLDQFFDSNAQLEAIWSNRLDGSFVYSNPKAALVNARMRPWFIQASAGHAYVSEIYTSALTKKACITLSFPIYKDNEIVGVLGSDLTIS